MRLEIIATTYHSTIFETHVFSLYFLLCIYAATRVHGISGLAAGSAREQIRDAPDNEDRVNSEINSEAVIERVW